MTNKHKRLITQTSALALSTACSLLLVPSAAGAQGVGSADTGAAPIIPAAEPEAANGSGDIIVTASRRATTALSTPINISAVSGEDLARSGVANFQDLSRAVAGLVYNSASIRDGGASSFIIHGLNLDGTGSGGERPLATIPPVAVYVGETPTFVNLHLADIQRIEVLRGPQATLYGYASIAGTLRVLFNEPDPSTFSANLSGNVGWTKHATGPNYTFDGVVNQPLTQNLALRVAAGYAFDHGFINAPGLYEIGTDGKPVLADPSDPVHSLPVRTSKKDVDDSKLAYVRAMLKYQDGPLKLLATYQHQYEHSDGPDQDSYPGGPGPSAFNTAGGGDASSPPFQNNGFDNAFPTTFKQYETGDFLLQPLSRTIDLGSLEGSYDFGFATLTSVTSLYDTDSSATNDSTAGYQKTLGFFYSGYPRINIPSVRLYDEKAVIQEVRLVSASGTPFTYSIGGFYIDQRSHLTSTDFNPGYTDYLNALGFANTGTDTGYIYARNQRFTDLAAFGELTYHFTPKWQVTGGVRVFKQKLDITAENALPICGPSCSQDGVNPLGVAEVSDRQRKKDVLFKANTSYQLGRTLAYFTFSQGIRRGGASGIPTLGPFAEDPNFQFYKPDSVDNYEIGLKGKIGSRFEFMTAGYYVDWHDPQVNVSTPNGGFPAVVNGSSARSLGVDLELHYRLTAELTLNGTYGYNDSKLTGPITVGGRSYGGDGQRLPGTPHHTASASADYEKELGGGLKLDARADVSYRSGFSTSLTPRANVDLPGFAVVGASVGFSKDWWRVTLYGDNLNDTRGVLSAVSLQSTDIRGINYRLSRPRTFGLRFAVNYR